VIIVELERFDLDELGLANLEELDVSFDPIGAYHDLKILEKIIEDKLKECRELILDKYGEGSHNLGKYIVKIDKRTTKRIDFDKLRKEIDLTPYQIEKEYYTVSVFKRR